MIDVSLKESTPHGNAMFPCELHEFKTDTALKERLSLHWHEEIEFLIVTNGEACFHIDTESHHVHKGDFIFVNSGHLHSAMGIDDMPFDFFAVVFNPTLLISYANDTIQQKYFDPVLSGQRPFTAFITPHEDWQKRVYGYFCNIRDIFRNKQVGYELQVKAALYIIWNLYYLNAGCIDEVTVNNSDYRIKRIKSILNYIHKNYRQQISICELSEIAGMSEGQLCRFFKLMVKMSVINYINYYRINESAQLLQKTDKTIGEIATDVGYNNISYFNRVFRRYMHCSPSELRRSLV